MDLALFVLSFPSFEYEHFLFELEKMLNFEFLLIVESFILPRYLSVMVKLYHKQVTIKVNVNFYNNFIPLEAVEYIAV